MGMSAAHCQGIVREMSGNFKVSGEWSPCKLCFVTLAYHLVIDMIDEGDVAQALIISNVYEVL